MAKVKAESGIPNFMQGYKPGDPVDKKKIASELERYLPLYNLQMIPTQEKFIRVKNKYGRMPKTRLFEGANQSGKCLCFQSLIDTTNGSVPVGELYRTGKPFDVYAWDGERRVVARAGVPFKKPGLHQCYRITMTDGQWIDAADLHRVLCPDGFFRSVATLASLFPSSCPGISDACPQPPEVSAFPLESTSGTFRRGRNLDVLHLNQTPSGCQDRCSRDFRQRGGPPLWEEDISRVFSPSLVDARQYSDSIFLRMGVQVSRLASNPWSSLYRPSSFYEVLLNALRCAGSLTREFCRAFELSLGGHQFFPQLSTSEGVQLRSWFEPVQYPHQSSSGVASFGPPEFTNKIESITLMDSLKEVYDFEVPVHHNYFAAGLVHHNSHLGVAEDIAHAMGFRPWLEPDDPDYKIPIQVPNTGLVGCEVAGQTLSQNIEPRFMKFIPAHCGAEKTRYSDGSIKSLTLNYDYYGKPCGSTINFRSYVQPAESFEGIIVHWIHWDEPPPQAILNAAERGKMSTNAPSWLTMTPLKEPYIYDLFSLRAFNNGGEDQEIAVFRCSVWQNCSDYCRDCDVTIPQNHLENIPPDSIRPVDKCPKCGRTMGFMPRDGIDNYLRKITDPDEREAREEGKWKHLSGVVYKQFSRDVHLYKDFEIPRDWMRIEVVDPHDAKPTRWLFGAVSPEEISIGDKPANRIYWYSYLLLQGTIHEMARQVRVKRAEQGYREPGFVILDAKYGTRTVKTQLDETSWEDELERAGIRGIRLSHSAPGDVAIGHKAVKEYLRPQFSALRGKEIPGMMWAETGCGGDRGPIMDMSNYSWDPGTEKPQEGWKDLCDCVRYAALEQPIYKAPEPDIDPALVKELLERRREPAYTPLGYGLSLRS